MTTCTTPLPAQTTDCTDQHIAQIAALFPHCVTERANKDKEGRITLERGIDFNLLKQELSHVLIEEPDERYRLEWVGKRQAILDSNKPIAKTLRPCREESVDFDTTENLFIEGDNLDALKLLQETYLGQIKMIYIDPPYNTGNDFIYKDDYSQDRDEYLEESGQTQNGYKMTANTETNGRFHSDWLTMMYSRLKIARNLLSDDGVIFISIDDNEVHNLRKICDEIFGGGGNFIAELIVNSNSSKNNAKKVSVSHEYLLCYVKDAASETSEWKVPKQQIKAYESKAKQLLKMNLTEEEIHQELLQLVKYPRFYDFDHYTYADKNGVYETDNSGGVTNGNFETEILHPITRKPCAKPSGGWRYKDETLQEMLKNDQIAFGEDETIIPRVKRYLHDYTYQVPKSNLFFDSQATTKWLKSEKLPFDFPKSIELIKHILSFGSDKNAIILDFFAGSSTTAHAVMQLNAEDGGNRQFIMVQIPQETQPKDEAYKAGYKTIAEISKERIRRAGAKIRADYAEKEGIEKLDTGFRVLKVDSKSMKDFYYKPHEYTQQHLFGMVDTLKPDRTSEDLLFEFMLSNGIPLSYSVGQIEVGGHTIYLVEDGAELVAYLDYVDTTMIQPIDDYRPAKVLIAERAIKSDSDKTNIIEQFKKIKSDIRVIFI